MTGANYMGGKRNAAKARSKDTTGRLQRGHFSRRRLGILTNGLIPRNSVIAAPTSASGVQNISLRHAKLDIATKPRSSQTGSESYVEPAAGPSAIGARPSATQSKVLQVLDTSEPVSLRAQIDRILAVPDLLGLARSPDPKRNPHHLSVGSSESTSEFGLQSSPLGKRPRVDGSEVGLGISYSTSPRPRISQPLNDTPAWASLVSSPIHHSGNHISVSSRYPITPVRHAKVNERDPARVSPLIQSHPDYQNDNAHLRNIPHATSKSQFSPPFDAFPSDLTSCSSTNPTPFSLVSHDTSDKINACHHESPVPHNHDVIINANSSNEAARFLESLSQSPDPWAFVGWEMLGLPIPSPASRSRIRAHDTQLLRMNRSRAGVGFVKPSEDDSNLGAPAQPAGAGEREDEQEVILDYDSSPPCPSHPVVSLHISREDPDSRKTTYPADVMKRTPERSERLFFSDFEEDSYFVSSDPGQLSSSNQFSIDHLDPGTAPKPQSSAAADAEAEDVSGFSDDRDICNANTDMLSWPVSVDENEHAYCHDLPDNSLSHFSSPRGNVNLDEPRSDSLVSAHVLSFPSSATPVSLSINGSAAVHSESDSTITVPLSYLDDTKSIQSRRQGSTVASQEEVGPTGSQLLTMYTNQDTVQYSSSPNPTAPSVPMRVAAVTTGDSILLDENVQVDEDENDYSGPCLFFDREDDEE